jgi:hypothetical protein
MAHVAIGAAVRDAGDLSSAVVVRVWCKGTTTPGA